MAVPVAMVAGAAMHIIGTVMGAKEADRVAKIMRNLPTYKPIDIGKAQQETVAGNIAVTPEATKMAAGVNQFNTSQVQGMLRKMIPDYDKILANVSGTIASQTRGELPADVAAMTMRSSAANAIRGGYAGSGAARNLSLRDLGLQSYQMTQQGIQNASNWLQVQKSLMPQPVTVESMFMTPGQRIGLQTQQNQLDYQSQLTSAFGKTTPGLTGYWSSALQQVGGSMMGGGMSGGLGGNYGAAGAETVSNNPASSNFMGPGAPGR